MAKSGSGMMLAMVALLGGVAVVGGYFFMKKKSTSEQLTYGDVPDNKRGGKLYDITTSDWYGATQFTAGGPPLAVLDTSARTGIPITSGSKRGYDIDRFAKEALGTCQCNTRECCYKSIYQPKHGDTDTKKVCNDIHYGDYVATCEGLQQEFSDRVFYGKVHAMSASLRQKHKEIENPYGSLLMQNRLRNIRS